MKFLIYLLLLLLTTLATPAYAATKTDETRLIRVGFPYFRGFSEFDEQGTHYGYMYDYLIEIAKYTGWKYEFTDAKTDDELINLLKMLETGELDIIPGVVRNEQTKKLYDFPEYNCGESYNTLVVLKNNNLFTETDLLTFDGMKVGVLQVARNGQQKLFEFSKSNGFSLSTVEFASEKAMFDALRTGTIDAALGVNLTVQPEVRTLVSFSSSPYYIVVAPNKKQILRELNTALIKIKEHNIEFDQRLFRKYFPQTFPDRFIMSEQEKQFVASLPVIRVVSGTHNVPVDYFTKNDSFAGITAGILARISEKTGIQFEYIKAKSTAAAYKMLKRGEADIVTGFYDEEFFRRLEGVIVSVPYISVPTLLVKNKQTVLPSGLATMPVLEPFLDKKRFAQYENTVSGLLKNLRTAKIDYFYADIYSVDYYRRYYGLTNINTVTLPDSDRSMAFGIRAPASGDFLALFNRAIRYITDEEKQRIIFDNIAAVQSNITLQGFIRANGLLVTLIVLLMCMIISGTLFLYLHKKRLMEKMSEHRYRILAKLSEEILFEYDFQNDTLMLSAESLTIPGLTPITRGFYHRYRAGELPFTVSDGFLENIYSTVASLTNKNEQEICLTLVDNTVRWYQAIFVVTKNKNGKKRLCLGKLRNIDRERREKEQLQEIASRDTLTGLYNKGAGEKLCREFLSASDANNPEKSGVFYLIDLDNFKQVNDTWGHLAGDETLCAAATVIQSPFRPNDIATRIGGDEFMIFVKNMRSIEKIREKAEIILQIFQNELSCRKDAPSVSCSIGIALYPQDGTVYEKLYEHADTALYKAKRRGKNTYCFYANEEQSVKK